jgi:hypothetical protein
LSSLSLTPLSLLRPFRCLHFRRRWCCGCFEHVSVCVLGILTGHPGQDYGSSAPLQFYNPALDLTVVLANNADVSDAP